MNDWLITNAHLVNEGRRFDADVRECGWSPFEGETFRSSTAATFVNGQLVWNEGKLDDNVRGQRLEFDR